MDLDNFKLVNDLSGHDMGDRMLQVFADIVRHNTRETDVISRIGGDEFMAFFANVTDESEVASLSRRLNAQMSSEAAKLMGKYNGIPLGISIGAVVVPEYGRKYSSLFGKADSALYSVKQNGKHGYAFYSSTDERPGNGTDGPEAEMERLTMIMNERNEQSGAMLLGSEAFAYVYRFAMRLGRRFQIGAMEMLFVIGAQNEETEAKLVYEAASQFGRIVQKALRRSDLIMQNRPDQFFVFLPNLSEKDKQIVIDRIMNRWNETEYAKVTKIDYTSRYIYDSGEYQR
jgi:diguanylate cyclase (GGDEF)-like protein